MTACARWLHHSSPPPPRDVRVQQHIRLPVIGAGKAGIERNRHAVAFERLFHTLQIGQRVAPVEMRFAKFGLQFDRPVTADQRLVVSLEIAKRIALVAMGFGEFGPECDGTIETGQCFVRLLRWFRT